MKQVLLFAVALFLISSAASSQSKDKKWAVGLMGGNNQYNGDLGNGFLKKPFYEFGSLSLNRYINSYLDASLQTSFGSYGYWKDSETNFGGKKFDVLALGKFKFNNGIILPEDFIVSPFATLGLGVATYQGDKPRIWSGGADVVVPMGLGVKYDINKWLAFQYQFLYVFTGQDNRDNYSADRRKDQYMQHSFGFVFSFGAPKDTDGDGIPDMLDKCAATPVGVKTDLEGCPVDTDKDGIADYLDKCPTEAGIAGFEGCPDTDGDGVQNSQDKCDNTPKDVKVDANGCPVDTDGDGVADYLDKCPSAKGLSQFNGCPDTDGDGIQDSEDRCPNIKGLAEFKGCPDRDGDRIPDIDDKCPDVAGIAANKGCPEVKEETKKIFQKALTGIQFEPSSDKIKATSNAILDQVVKVMIENPTYAIEINGHTDSQGDAAKNLELSQKRADAVKNYLNSKGVANERMTSKGYGSTIPIADNATPAGRSQNRRVEFKVIF